MGWSELSTVSDRAAGLSAQDFGVQASFEKVPHYCVAH